MSATNTLLKNAASATTNTAVLRTLTALSSELHQALIGQLLGDAHVHRSSPTSNTRIEWSFGLPYPLYGEWINTLFEAFCGTPLSTLKSGQMRLKTLTLPLFNLYHALFYVRVNGRWIKVVPASIDALMTPIVLAHLIMSDGSYNASSGCVFIYVNAFTREDCVRLASAITAMGVKTTVRIDREGSNGAKQYKLAIAKAQLPTLRSLVVPHTHKTMMYRLGLLDPLLWGRVASRVNELSWLTVCSLWSPTGALSPPIHPIP